MANNFDCASLMSMNKEIDSKDRAISADNGKKINKLALSLGHNTRDPLTHD